MKFTSIPELYTLFKQNSTITTDTRSIEKGSLFFALKGNNFDGNNFAEKAIEAGAAYSVVDSPIKANKPNCLLVPNVLESLQELAKYHRKQLNIPVIAITGSNGKTTTKELINAVLSEKYKTLATKGNLNNHIGVPLTLLNINNSHQIAIIEMGANHQKEIEFLCSIALPDFCLITNIGKAHLEGFGGIEGVIKGKNEMFVYAKENNKKVFVNSDDSLLMKLSDAIQRATYGTNEQADDRGKIITSEPFVNFEFVDKNKEITSISSQLVGSYNLPNLLSACAIGKYFEVKNEHIKNAIENYTPTNSRSQIIKKGTNSLILDAYNANPTSMEAAIINFSKINSENKIVVLGDMLELGEDTAREHQQILNILKQHELTDAVLVGPYFMQTENVINAKRFENSNEARDFLKSLNIENSYILIKGSRGIKMEEVISSFED